MLRSHLYTLPTSLSIRTSHLAMCGASVCKSTLSVMISLPVRFCSNLFAFVSKFVCDDDDVVVVVTSGVVGRERGGTPFPHFFQGRNAIPHYFSAFLAFLNTIGLCY